MGDKPSFVSKLPVWAEMTVVILLTFGLFIYSSTYFVFADEGSLPASSSDFRWTLATELMLGGIAGLFLWMRGWRLETLGIVPPNWLDLRHGGFLLAATILCTWITFYGALLFRPDLATASLSIDEDGVSPALAIAFSIINASFEEVFVCAYIVAAWRGADMWSAIAVSSLIRVSYHLYQGPVAIVTIFPLAVIFAWYFARQRRIWPFVLAHAALDLIAFWQSNARS